MLRKLERAGLQADLASVNALLASLNEDDDPIAFAQFAARRAEIEAALADLELDAEAIGRARARTEQTQIDTETVEEEGVLVGLVPQRKRFEWHRLNGETIGGAVQADVARVYEQSLFAEHPLLGKMRARFQVRKVSRRGGVPRFAYTLLQVSPLN